MVWGLGPVGFCRRTYYSVLGKCPPYTYLGPLGADLGFSNLRLIRVSSFSFRGPFLNYIVLSLNGELNCEGFGIPKPRYLGFRGTPGP